MPKIFDCELQNSRLALWKITEPEHLLVESLTPKDKQVMQGFKSLQRRKEFAATRCLLDELLPLSEIAYLTNGAPYLLGNHDFSLSISHTQDYVAVLLSRAERCAVDIELKFRDTSKIRDRYLSSNELRLAQGTNFELIIWCAKEVAYKYLQRTEVDFLKDLVLTDFDFEAQKMTILAFSEQKLELKFEFFENLVISYII